MRLLPQIGGFAQAVVLLILLPVFFLSHPGELRLDGDHAVDQLVVGSLKKLQILQDRIGQVRLIDRIARDDLVLHADDAPGNTDDGTVGRDGFQDNGARADLGIRADPDGAQDFCPGGDHHAVLERRVALSLFFSRTSERYALVQGDIVTDFTGLADDDTGAVVNEESLPDGRTGMDLDARPADGDLREQACAEMLSFHPELVGLSVIAHGCVTGVKKDIPVCANRGIAFFIDLIGLLQLFVPAHISSSMVFVRIRNPFF